MNVRLTEAAASDLENIKTHIEQHDGAAADNVVQRIGAVIGLLGHWPHIGHDGVVPGTFEMVVARLPFVIVYRVDVGEIDDELVILRVYHVRRDRSQGAAE